jgi:hypothetical protein
MPYINIYEIANHCFHFEMSESPESLRQRRRL